MRKSKKAPKPAPVDDRVLATPERLQHGAVEYGERTVFSELGGRGTSKSIGHRVLTQRAYDWMRAHRVIDERQHVAADRLWMAWHQSGLTARLVANLSGGSGGGSDPAYMTPASERAAAARQALRRHLGAVPGRIRPVVVAVVIDDRTLEDYAAGAGLRADHTGRIEARTRLRLALDIVADSMGL